MKSHHNATIAAALVLSYSAGNAAMASPRKNIFEIIAAVERSLPLSREGVQAALDVMLAPDVGSREDFLGSGFALGDGLVVTKVDLRIRKYGFLLLGVGGRCSTLEEIQPGLGPLRAEGFDLVHGSPTAVGFSDKRGWGTLKVWFQFPERDCLSSISFSTNSVSDKE